MLCVFTLRQSSPPSHEHMSQHDMPCSAQEHARLHLFLPLHEQIMWSSISEIVFPLKNLTLRGRNLNIVNKPPRSWILVLYGIPNRGKIQPIRD